MNNAHAAEVITFLHARGFRLAAITQLLREKDPTTKWAYERKALGQTLCSAVFRNNVIVWTDVKYVTKKQQAGSSSDTADSISTLSKEQLHRSPRTHRVP